jgi:hypothetical protein
MLVMVGLLQGVGDIEHRQPAMTDPPQANLQNSPDTTLAPAPKRWRNWA